MKNVVLVLLTVLMASPAFAARKLSGSCELFDSAKGSEVVEIPFDLDPATRYGLIASTTIGSFQIQISMKYVIDPDKLGQYKDDGLHTSIRNNGNSASGDISGVALNVGETGRFAASNSSTGQSIACQVVLK